MCGVRSAADRVPLSPVSGQSRDQAGRPAYPLSRVDVRIPLVLSERVACPPLGRRVGRKNDDAWRIFFVQPKKRKEAFQDLRGDAPRGSNDMTAERRGGLPLLRLCPGPRPAVASMAYWEPARARAGHAIPRAEHPSDPSHTSDKRDHEREVPAVIPDPLGGEGMTTRGRGKNNGSSRNEGDVSSRRRSLRARDCRGRLGCGRIR